MDCLLWLSEGQLERIKPFFPKSRGVSRVDDRKVLSGIIYVLHHGLLWVDAPAPYGPCETLYNPFRRWSEKGGFQLTSSDLARSAAAESEAGAESEEVLLNAPLWGSGGRGFKSRRSDSVITFGWRCGLSPQRASASVPCPAQRSPRPRRTRTLPSPAGANR